MQYALSLVGAVVHTLNFRLPEADLLYTVQHAEDDILFVWEGFKPLGLALQPYVRHVVWMLEEASTASYEGETLYEDLIIAGNAHIGMPDVIVDETDPFSIFYTTGTTGRPKGLRYRHRDMLLAALQIAHQLAMHDTGATLASGDTIMPLIPFFHIHGWGTPFFASYLGSKLVLPERADATEQLQLIHKEAVTWSNIGTDATLHVAQRSRTDWRIEQRPFAARVHRRQPPSLGTRTISREARCPVFAHLRRIRSTRNEHLRHPPPQRNLRRSPSDVVHQDRATAHGSN